MQVEFDRKSLLSFFEAINNLATEGHLHIQKDSMFLSSVDLANVAFIYANFKGTFDEEVNLAVDIQKLKSTVGALSSKNVMLTFAHDIHIKGGKVERDIRSLNPSTIRKEITMPGIELPVCVEVPSIDFIEIVESINKMGEAEGSLPIKMCFEYDKKKLIIHCTNDLHETTKLEFDTISTERGEGCTHKSFFSFDYIRDFVKSIKKIGNDTTKISLGTNVPLKLETSKESMSFIWMLAPRIED